MNASSDSCNQVRNSGEQLIQDLREAEHETKMWSNRSRSNREVSRVMNACLDRLALTGCLGEENRVPSSVLWNVAGDVLARGWLQNHARRKPRGYAGDFEMLHKIVDRTLCTDPLGRAFDHFFLEQAAPHAVRSRTQLVADQIVETVRSSTHRTIHICSFGCGPAIDIEIACRILTSEDRTRLVVTLLDFDPEALTYAERRVAPLLADEQLHLHRENLFRLPRSRRTDALSQKVDLMVCTGLFDYLTDSDAVEMLRYFWDQLSAGGEVIVFNFAPSNPSRAYMEWIGNWYLTYRDIPALESIVQEAVGASVDCEIAWEASGASLYARCLRSGNPASDMQG